MKFSNVDGGSGMDHNLTEVQRNQLEALAEEYAERKRQGEGPSIDEYVEKYPELAHDIRELFPVVVMLDKVGGKDNLDSAAALSKASSETIEGEICPGTRLGEYQLIRPIGRGGMGVVYQAEHIVLGSDVAIKLLPNSRGRSKMRERFQREASAAARMHHPNIVRVFDFGTHGDTLYYVMSLVDGWGLDRIIGCSTPAVEANRNDPKSGTLGSPTKWQLSQTFALTEDRLPNSADQGSSYTDGIESDRFDLNDTNPDLPDPTRQSSGTGSRTDNLWNWVSRIGIQAADALAYAHSNGVVHRDIKPSNLMIDADNQLFVTDFGLAKVADDSSLTGTGDLLGTLRYMPPESFLGHADHRSDVYGLGMTLYELLADQAAFAETDRGNLISAITNGQVAALQKRAPGIPVDLETIVHKAIEGEPESRYQTAAELRDDLQRFLNGQPVMARPATLAYKTAKWIGRNRVVSILAACVTFLLVTAAIFYAISANRSAFANLQQQLADERQQSADRITSVFDRLLRNYDASYQERQNISVQELLKDASDLLDTEFAKEPLVEAKLRITVGNACLWSNTTDSIVNGQDHLQRAVDLLRQNNGNPADLARALTGLAFSRNLAATPTEANPLGLRTDFDATLPILEEALALHESINEPGLSWAETLNVLAKLEANRGNFEVVAQLSQQGLAMIQDDASDDAKRLRAILIGRLAGSNAVAGEYEKAEKQLREALGLSKKLNNFYLKIFAYNLGELQLEQGRFQDAEATFSEHVTVDPFIFSPKVTMAIALQGDWQRALEWSAQALDEFNRDDLHRNSWESLVASRLHAQYLRLSGDDQQAMLLLQKTVRSMGPMIDPDSPQHKVDYIKASYYLARIMLFSEDTQIQAAAIMTLQSIRGQLDPTSPSSTSTIRLGYALAISQFPNNSAADFEQAEECIRLLEESYAEFVKSSVNRPKLRESSAYQELLFAKALLENAKGNRSAAIDQLMKMMDIADGHDIRNWASMYREPTVVVPTLRIAEDVLVNWLIEDDQPKAAIQVLEQAIQSRMESEVPAQHQINFAKARLGRLLLQLNRKAEARDVLGELAEVTNGGPDCFHWLEERVAADLDKTR